jgi:hypothetical protein
MLDGTYGFQHRHERIVVLSQDTHDSLASDTVASFDVADLHCEGQHTRETEWHTFGILLSVHSHLETVTEIDVHHTTGCTIEQQVGRVSIAQTKNVTNHGHDTKRSGVVGASLKPGLRALTLEPQDPVEIFAGGIVHSISENLDLLHESKAVVVWCHLQHDSVLNVEQDTSAFAVLLDQGVKGVGVTDPSEQTGALRQRDCREALDREMALETLAIIVKKRVAQAEKLHNTLVLTNILVTLKSIL